MNRISKKVQLYTFSGLIGFMSLIGGFSFEPNTVKVNEPARAEQIVKAPASKLEEILKSVKFGPATAYAKEVGEYAAPTKVDGRDAYVLNGKEYSFDKTFKIDVDKNGTKESDVRLYKNSDGDLLASLSTNGRTWVWTRTDHNYINNGTDITKNYTLRDSNCDGIFNVRYANNEEFTLPSCINE